MKKIFTLVALLSFALVMNAQDKVRTYTDNMVVIVNDESTDPMPTTISITEQADGKYTLALNNFILVSKDEESGEDDPMPVGTISISDLEPAVAGDGTLSFSAERDIILQPGDMEGVDFWLGPILSEELGGIPITLKADLSADKEQLLADIDIDLSTVLGQKIKVLFGQALIDKALKISEVKSENNSRQKGVYNLQGQKVGADFNGIIVVNGKKIIKK